MTIWNKDSLNKLQSIQKSGGDISEMIKSIADLNNAYNAMAQLDAPKFVIKLNTLFTERTDALEKELKELSVDDMLRFVSHQDFDYSKSPLFKEWLKVDGKKDEFLVHKDVQACIGGLGVGRKINSNKLLYSKTTAPYILFNEIMTKHLQNGYNSLYIIIQNQKLSKHSLMFAPSDIISHDIIKLDTTNELLKLAKLVYPYEHLIWDCQRSYAKILREKDKIIESLDPLLYRLLNQDFWLKYITTKQCTPNEIFVICHCFCPTLLNDNLGHKIKEEVEKQIPERLTKFHEAQQNCDVIKQNFDFLMKLNPKAISTHVIMECLHDEDYINTFNKKNAEEKIAFLNIVYNRLKNEEEINWRQTTLVLDFVKNNKQTIIDGLSSRSMEISLGQRSASNKTMISPYLHVIDENNIKQLFHSADDVLQTIRLAYNGTDVAKIFNNLNNDNKYYQAYKLANAYCQANSIKISEFSNAINRQEEERIEKERIEKERIEKERIEKERLEKERIEKERIEKERIEKERIEKERIEKERIEKERIEKERLERERGKERIVQRKPVKEEKKAQKASYKYLYLLDCYVDKIEALQDGGYQIHCKHHNNNCIITIDKDGKCSNNNHELDYLQDMVYLNINAIFKHFDLQARYGAMKYANLQHAEFYNVKNGLEKQTHILFISAYDAAKGNADKFADYVEKNLNPEDKGRLNKILRPHLINVHKNLAHEIGNASIFRKMWDLFKEYVLKLIGIDVETTKDKVYAVCKTSHHKFTTHVKEFHKTCDMQSLSH